MAEVITVENLSLCYQPIGYKPLLFRKKESALRYDALKQVSFSVNEGEILGIIGDNGSGKSTLLRVIAGVLKQDQGTIDLHNRTAALLALGLGFNSSLTGRDNIYLSGLLRGFSKAQLRERIDRIAEFSELGAAIDNPVSSYSSGMRSRLSFSVAVELQPDILLLDEVLSVGDTGFQKKSMQKMKEIINEDGRTVLIVSHNLRSLKKLCDKVMWLDKGSVQMIGGAAEVLRAYEDAQRRQKSSGDGV